MELQLKPRRTSRKQFLARQFLLGFFVDSVIFPEDWTFDELLDLHSILLNGSLSELTKESKSKQGIKMKMEILEWVFADDLKVEKLANGEVKITYIADLPLSFSMCCRLANINPDRYRQEIFKNLEKRWQSLLLKAEVA